MKLSLGKINKPALSGFLALLLLSGVALAGSLSPSASPGSTFNTLAEVYNSIASTFDSSAISASTTGSLIQHLKYIEANLGSSRPASNSLDFDELANSLTLDANTTITGGAFSLTFDHASVSSNFEIRGTASVSGATTFNGIGYTWPSAQGGASTLLTNNGSGVLSWATGIAPLSATTSVGSLAVAGGTNCLAVQGRYAYNCESGILRVYDIGGSAPVLVSAVTSSVALIKQVVVQGRYAYTYGNTSPVLDVIDISNPTTPTKVGSVAAGSSQGNYLAVQGKYAYAYSNNTGTLYVIDVSVPTAPVVVSSTTGLSISGANGNFSVQGRYLYAPGSSTTMKVIDIADPKAPAAAGSVGSFPATLQSAIVHGRYVYVGSGSGLSVVDVIDPVTPVLLNTVSIGGTCYQPYAPGGIYVFCARYSSPGIVSTIDVSTPASPTVVESFTAVGRPYRITGLGGYIYVATDDGTGIQIIKPTNSIYVQQVNSNGPIDGSMVTSRGDVNAIGDVRAAGSGVFSRGILAGPSGVQTLTSTGIGIGTKNILPSLIGSSSFAVLNSAATSGTIASISATALTTGNVFGIRANSVTTGSIASISATALAGGSVFNLRLPASSQANNAHGLLLAQDTAGRIIASWSMGGSLSIAGALRSDGAVSNCTGVNTPTSGCIDYAESYPTSDPSLQAGELVALSEVEGPVGSVIRATHDSVVLGVISTNPATLITGSSFLTGSSAADPIPGTVPLALAGRVPVRISGPVSAGDHLTLSDVPGTAKTQTEAGMSVGIALESSSGPSTGSGQVMTFVNLGYWAPSFAKATEGITSVDPASWDWSSVMHRIQSLFASLWNITIEEGLVRTARGVFGKVEADEMCLQGTCVTGDQLQKVLQLIQENSVTPMPSPTEMPTPTPEPTLAE